MIKNYTRGDLLWIDLTSPSKEEVRELMEQHNLSLSIAEELLSPSPKPKIELNGNSFYLILHFPALKHSHSGSSTQEVDFVVGKNVVITTRYDSIDPVHKFAKEFEVSNVLQKKRQFTEENNTTGILFYDLIMRLYESLEHELEYVQDSIKGIEENIFAGHEKDMVRSISDVSRILLDFKQVIISHAQVLDSLELIGRSFFGDEYGFYLNKITESHYRISSTVARLQETLSELRNTNNSLLTTKQNEVMKILTIMAFVTFPLSLIATIFGMNTVNAPIVGNPNDFWMIITIMVILTTSFFIFFKTRKWL